ncbi:type VI secretion system protein TssL [Rhodoferax lacus]|uniref:Type VI secretion system protein TssL n=1 Tax=Rhodoferax lacus TaxID=2184758 RepID=A0A3E1RA46_9BURK|nr:type VI secretion system protein TssL, long form [Rhodoferax lacus]RFO96238.1 type VI secretion system protein TssL [Rhodoferax lacus]
MKNDIPFPNTGGASGGGEPGSGFPAIQGTDAALVFEPGPNHDTRLSDVLLAIEQNRNPFLEAASVLLRSLAELPRELHAEGLHGLHTLLTQELQTYTRLCEQANLRRDHMLAVRYALCTALDEAISQKPWAGGEAGNTGMWSTQALLNQFHGESQGGKTVFLLIGRLANAPEEHMPVLEVIHHLLSLGFMGDYRVQADGHRMIETIRHRLYTMVWSGREPVARELSPHWQGVGQGKFKLLRSVPVWVSASVLGLALFAQFSWYKYGLLSHTAAVEKNIQALASLQPPPQRKPVNLNLAALLQAEIAQGRLKVDENAERALVVFTGDGMFAGGLDKLSPGSLAILDKVAGAIQQVSGTVRVIGHTDNQPIATPEFPSNQALSEKRAQSVVRVLQAKGLDAARLQALGKGDSQPVGPNTTDAGRAANRRVEIEVSTLDTASAAQTGASAPAIP